MQHTQPFRSCVLLLKCFNYMDAFAECDLLRLPFLKAICFSKQTAGLILIYLSKFLSTPTLSHRRDKKTRIRVSCETLSSSFAVLCFLSLVVTHLRALFHGLTLDLFESCDSQLSRTAHSVLASSKCSRATQVNHILSDWLFNVSLVYALA